MQFLFIKNQLKSIVGVYYCSRDESHASDFGSYSTQIEVICHPYHPLS